MIKKPQWLVTISPNCLEATQVQSRELDGKIPLNARLGLRLHRLICQSCRRYARQTQLMGTAFRRANEQPKHGPKPSLQRALPLEVRAQIKARLNQAGRL